MQAGDSDPSSLSGRAKLGARIEIESKAFNMLVAIESCIYEMVIDPNVASKPVPCQLTEEDYSLTQTVRLFAHSDGKTIRSLRR